MKITKASIEHINELVTLFDAYRIFYEQTSDLKKAKRFLIDRFEQNESVIYIAFIDNKAVGFTQLYYLFSSVSMERMYLLNDLYVDANHRNKGVGEALIDAAKNNCKDNNFKGLAIQTAFNNPAQNLYKRLGFKKDTDLHFFWSNTNN